jgi:hypothetical protein
MSIFENNVSAYRIGELLLGTVAAFVGFVNLLKILGTPKLQRDGPGYAIRILLILGGILLAIGGGLAAYKIHGKTYAGSAGCNEVPAYLFTLGLMRSAYLTMGRDYIFKHSFRKFVYFTLLFLVVLTPLLWGLSLYIMFEVNPITKWKVLSYVPNGVTLCLLAFTVLISTTHITRKSIHDGEIRNFKDRKNCIRQIEIRCIAFLVFVFSCALGIYCLFVARKVYLYPEPFYHLHEDRPLETVRDIMITRAIGVGFLVALSLAIFFPPSSMVPPPPPPDEERPEEEEDSINVVHHSPRMPKMTPVPGVDEEKNKKKISRGRYVSHQRSFWSHFPRTATSASL